MIFSSVRSKMFPCPQRLPRLCIQRNVFQRSFRFRRTLHHRHYRPKDVQDEVFEIHVLPPKPDQFSQRNPVKASNSIIVRSGSRNP
jgi:hypothetical protein